MIFRKTMSEKGNMLVKKSKKTKISGETVMDEDAMARMIDWNTYYRRNFHRFAEEMLDMKLHLFQKIILYIMCVNNTVSWIASRAVGKSWLTAVYCVIHAILYPNAKIVIASAKLSQAGLIITEKIQKELMPNFPMIEREIKNIKANANEYEVLFKNGSTISVVASLDTSRGIRSNVIILEEYRLIKKLIVDTVIIPFNITRNAPYRSIKEYEKVITDRSKKIYISSAYWKSNWMWENIKNTTTEMLNGKKSAIIANDLFTSLLHRIKTYEEIFGEKAGMDESTFQMEYENSMLGEGEDAYYKSDRMNSLRTIRNGFKPFSTDELVSNKHKDHHYSKYRKDDGSLRTLTVDVAVKSGKKNDNAIIGCLEARPFRGGYKTHVDYIQSMNGWTITAQVVRIKSLYYEYGSDYAVIDVGGLGAAMIEELGKITIDNRTGEIFPAWTLIGYNKQLMSVSKDVYADLKNSVTGDGAIPVVYPIQGTSALNHKIAVNFSVQMNSGKINFLADEQVARESVVASKEFRKDRNISKEEFVRPYIETTEFINECVGLDMEVNNGLIKLTEKSGYRKDRYVAIAYGSYFISQKESEILKGNANSVGYKAYAKAIEKTETTKKNKRRKLGANKRFNSYKNKYS